MAGMYGSFGDIKKVVGVVAILLVAAFFLGFGMGMKFGSGGVTSSNAGTLSPEERKQIKDSIDNAIKPNNTNSNAAAGGATASPLPTPASNESFADRLKRQREAANK